MSTQRAAARTPCRWYELRQVAIDERQSSVAMWLLSESASARMMTFARSPSSSKFLPSRTRAPSRIGGSCSRELGQRRAFRVQHLPRSGRIAWRVRSRPAYRSRRPNHLDNEQPAPSLVDWRQSLNAGQAETVDVALCGDLRLRGGWLARVPTG